MAEKLAILKQTDQELAAFKKALAGLSEEKLREVWYGQWCVVDILAHIAGWFREMTPALERIRRGERANPEGHNYGEADPWNVKFVREAGPLSPKEASRLLDQTYARFRQAAELVPEERYAPGRTAYQIVDVTGATHLREHREDILKWLAT